MLEDPIKGILAKEKTDVGETIKGIPAGRAALPWPSGVPSEKSYNLGEIIRLIVFITIEPPKLDVIEGSAGKEPGGSAA